MATETFDVAVTDQQLTDSGLNLGSAGSKSVDGVTLNYTITSDGAGGNTVAVTVLYRPFYVALADVQTYITELLTTPPAGQAESTPPADASAPAVAAAQAESEQSGRRRHRE